jgi:hypothetical protein
MSTMSERLNEWYLSRPNAKRIDFRFEDMLAFAESEVRPVTADLRAQLFEAKAESSDYKSLYNVASSGRDRAMAKLERRTALIRKLATLGTWKRWQEDVFSELNDAPAAQPGKAELPKPPCICAELGRQGLNGGQLDGKCPCHHPAAQPAPAAPESARASLLQMCDPPGNLPECGAWHDHYNRCSQPAGHQGDHYDGDRMRWHRGGAFTDVTERPEPSGAAPETQGEAGAVTTEALESVQLYGADSDGGAFRLPEGIYHPIANGIWCDYNVAVEAAESDIRANVARETEALRKEVDELKRRLDKRDGITAIRQVEARVAALTIELGKCKYEALAWETASCTNGSDKDKAEKERDEARQQLKVARELLGAAVHLDSATLWTDNDWESWKEDVRKVIGALRLF